MLPAMMPRWPNVPLCPPAGRASGKPVKSSAWPSSRSLVSRHGARPMSGATRSRPTNSEALGCSRPRLAAPSVSVSVARIAAPCTSPVAAFTPEGTSTESIRSRLALSCAITCIQSALSGRFSPMPNRPSTTSAGAGSRSSGSFWRVLAGSVTLSRLTSRSGR